MIVKKEQNRIESVTGPEVMQKYKFEVDALRARFKMMHSTGAFFDRSPSTSESEQNAEVSSGRLFYLKLWRARSPFHSKWEKERKAGGQDRQFSLKKYFK